MDPIFFNKYAIVRCMERVEGSWENWGWKLQGFMNLVLVTIYKEVSWLLPGGNLQ